MPTGIPLPDLDPVEIREESVRASFERIRSGLTRYDASQDTYRTRYADRTLAPGIVSDAHHEMMDARRSLLEIIRSVETQVVRAIEETAATVIQEKNHV